MEFTHPYLTEQIIAYIGNKRKLLPLIYNAIENTGLDIKSDIKFLDVFSGSGVVSRFAKYLGFEVFSNDWEYYATVLNYGFLMTDNSTIKNLFGSEEKFEDFLESINNLPDPAPEEQYIAKYYAPKEFETEKANANIERLFYTRENALTIDKIRNFIEKKLPEALNRYNLSDSEEKIKNILTSLLIYESATHTNTSGVFKAFHKEFGGHGKDALKRITTPIRLNKPILIDTNSKIHVFQEDANLLVKHIKNIDIAYLDPPYNQHQYGSNYHLLNTIAKWDKIPAPLDLNEKGELKQKAAIRSDWIKTRSSYCYRIDAEKSFEDLINNIDAKYILISYSTDGIIPFEKMREICMNRGKLSIVTNEYTTYRGGKQSNKRQNSNIEFILCIDTSKKSDQSSIDAIDFILKRKKTLLLFKQKFSYQKLVQNFGDGPVIFSVDGVELIIQDKDFFTFTVPENFYELTSEQLDEFYKKFSMCVCETKEEELKEILLRMEWQESDKKKLIKMIPSILNKLANNKNKEAYFYWIQKIEELKNSVPDQYIFIEEKIEKVKDLARKRIK